MYSLTNPLLDSTYLITAWQDVNRVDSNPGRLADNKKDTKWRRGGKEPRGLKTAPLGTAQTDLHGVFEKPTAA